jgi:hypothetical protein
MEGQISGTVLIGSPERSKSAVKEDDYKLKN